MKRILITGSNGQLGMNILNQLCKEPNFYIGEERLFDITALYNNNDDNLPKNITKIHFDLMNQDSKIFEILKEQDIVIHTAGYINVTPKNEEEKTRIYNVNQLGSIKFIKNCELAGVKNLIYISSIEALLSEGQFKLENLYSTSHTTYYGHCKAKTTQFILDECLIPNRHIIYPSGIISTVSNRPSPLMEFIYSIPNSFIQIYPESKFYFVDGDSIAKDVKKLAVVGLEWGVSYKIMLGKKINVGEIIEITKTIKDNKIFPLSFSIPSWILGPVATIGELLGSTQINDTVFSILTSENLLIADDHNSSPTTEETLRNALEKNKYKFY